MTRENETEKEPFPALGQSFEWPRILRPILHKEQHKIIDICNLEGELERVV